MKGSLFLQMVFTHIFLVSWCNTSKSIYKDIQVKACLHLSGTGLVVQHYTQNEECDVTEELEPIDKNLRYDFSFQVYVSHILQCFNVTMAETL